MAGDSNGEHVLEELLQNSRGVIGHNISHCPCSLFGLYAASHCAASVPVRVIHRFGSFAATSCAPFCALILSMKRATEFARDY